MRERERGGERERERERDAYMHTQGMFPDIDAPFCGHTELSECVC